MELQVLDNKGKQAGTVQFDEGLLPKQPKSAVLHEVLVAFQANQRAGTHETKGRSQVSGGGVKPWRQKGTGRARSGSIRSPLWRKGGIIFGPHQRSYRQELPKKKKRLAFRAALKGLFDDGRLQVVEPIELKEAKTRNVAEVYKRWKVSTGCLLVVERLEPDFVRASRNIAAVRVVDVQTVNVYDCLSARQVFITPTALEQLATRLGKTVER